MAGTRTALPSQIVDEASDWFVLMRDASVSEEQRAAFAEWLRSSPMHVGAYLDIARLWADAAQLDSALSVELTDGRRSNVIRLGNECRPAAAEREFNSASAVACAPQQQGGDLDTVLPAGAAHDGQAAGGRPRLFRQIALAASLAAICIIGGITWWQVSRETTYVTGVGEQRVITLEDGSIVTMNSRSRFKVRLSAYQRRIELVEGQALFAVAHDSARPFIVTGGDVAVRAVGTQFDVNRKRSGMVVTVIDGRVKVGAVAPSGLFGTAPATLPTPMVEAVGSGTSREADSNISESSIFLSAGEQARVSPAGTIQRTDEVNTAAAISWLHHELIFAGQPLADVLEEFNRYSRIPIVLMDPALGELRINAVFHTTAPDSLIRFLSRLEDVQIDTRSGKEIRISTRKADDQLTLRLDPSIP